MTDVRRTLYHFFKRLFDFVASGLGILLLSPLLIFVSCMVWIKLGKPIFFKQPRPGLKGKIFTMYKFRTMSDERDKHGQLLPDEHRLPAFGRFLRSTSLDELPELLNVLKGDMSLVGPRPLLTRYLERYDAFQARRHEVRPGITGWAQVNGRNALSWEEKFTLDVWYVDNASFVLDLKILWLTIAKILKREGISQDGQATVEEFMGTEKGS